MTVQFVEIAGQKMAVLHVADYERLVDIVEDRADAAAAERAAERRERGEEYVPAELVDAMLARQSPLRVWRKHRGLTLEQLASMSGARHATLSDIENGKAQGKPALWKALANALDVSVDDILPDA
jgi:DNA-binding XRE family transcriptional regulator